MCNMIVSRIPLRACSEKLKFVMELHPLIDWAERLGPARCNVLKIPIKPGITQESLRDHHGWVHPLMQLY